MPRITFPNRDRKARATPSQSPDEYLRNLARDHKTPPHVLRKAITALPDPILNRAWANLSHWECDRLWAIYRSGHSRRGAA
jgi:hypothetical protein